MGLWNFFKESFCNCVGVKESKKDYIESPYDEDEELDRSGNVPVVKNIGFEEQNPGKQESTNGIVNINERIQQFENLLEGAHEETLDQVDCDCIILENSLIDIQSSPKYLQSEKLFDLTLCNEDAQSTVEQGKIKEVQFMSEEFAAPSISADSECNNERIDFTETDTDNEEERFVCDISFNGGMPTNYKTIKTLYDRYNVARCVFDRISLWKGDITKLEVDAIVNAANSGLRGGGGVDGSIHRAAGYAALQKECRQYENGCEVGNTVITSACGIKHVKNILHTVGPQVTPPLRNVDRSQLISCYRTALELAVKYELKSVAFPCISTGVYGYPNDDAAKSVFDFLCDFFSKQENQKKIDRVIIVLFMPIDVECYCQCVKKAADKFEQIESKTTLFFPSTLTREDKTEDQDKEIGAGDDASIEVTKMEPQQVLRKRNTVSNRSDSGESAFADSETSPATKKSK